MIIIYALKQGHLSVSDHYTSLEILWDEFSNIRPIMPCTCGKFGNEVKGKKLCSKIS